MFDIKGAALGFLKANYLFSPRSFNEIRVECLLPSMIALHLRAVSEETGNIFPVFRAIILNDAAKGVILNTK